MAGEILNIVILAAGKGTRLDQNKNQPKALTCLANGKTILEMQLEALAACFPLKQISVVVGFQQQEIRQLYPQLTYIENPEYAAENTAKSLLKAISSDQKDLLWLNGDVVFQPSILQKLVSFDRTCMVVNQGEVGEEEIKYRTDGKGRILEVSKSVLHPEGEAIGMNLFKAPFVPTLKESLVNCHKSDYFEKGIELCIQKDIPVQALTIERNACIEIDFAEDLIRANELIKHWK